MAELLELPHDLGGQLHAPPASAGPVRHGPHEAEAGALAWEPADDLDPPAATITIVTAGLPFILLHPCTWGPPRPSLSLVARRWRLADEVVAEPVVAVQLLVEALALVGADRAGRYRLQVRVYIRQVGVADRVGPPS